MKTLLRPPRPYRRAIVWTDERPAMPRLPIERAEAAFSVRGRVSATSHEAAVEILVPVGPMAQYALVGGVFEERAGEMLELRIDLTTDDRAAPFPSEIALTTDGPFCGIPREYLRGITDGVEHSVREEAFPGGLLHVNVGAHGLVGSSIVAFRRATRMLMRLIVSGMDRLKASAAGHRRVDAVPMKFLCRAGPRLLAFLRPDANVSRQRNAVGFAMLDTIFIAATLIFFAITAAYALACAKL